MAEQDRNQQDDAMQIDSNENIDNSSRPPAISVQRAEIKRLLDATMRRGETWYLIDASWLDQFKKYVNFSLDDNDKDDTPGGNPPRQIDNSELIESSSSSSSNNNQGIDVSHSSQRLKMGVLEGQHYEYVPAEAWQKLFSWYGGGPAIPRKTYEFGEYKKQVRAELHPCFVHVACYTMQDATAPEPQPLKFTELYFAKHETLKDVKESLAQFFNCDGADFETHLWAAYKGSPYKMYKANDLAKELENILTRSDGQQLVLEVKNRTMASSSSDNGWPLGYKHSDSVGGHKASGIQAGFLNNNAGASLYPDYVTSRIDRNANEGHGDGSGAAGICGLTNLGNTCFMNSALQCLTKTPSFRSYFCSQGYKKEINYDNPLGMKGRIALAFGNLMNDMWSGKFNYVTPREFKTTIGQFAPQFSGYSQQDSQELIAYLLDGLHEDLNRIIKKPATQPVESNGRPDFVVAKEAWDTHKLRNDSFIVDKFQGQLKSTLVCPDPECIEKKFVSVTFDPFMYLSVPLPVEKHTVREVVLNRFLNSQPPTKYAVKIPKFGSVSEIREALAKVVNEGIEPDQPGYLKAEEVVLADVFQGKIFKFWNDSFNISSISDNDKIFAYEVPGLTKQSHSEYESSSAQSANKPFPFLAIRLMTQERISNYSYGAQERQVIIGQPLVIPFDRKTQTNKQLYESVLATVKMFLKVDQLPSGFDWNCPETLFSNICEEQVKQVAAGEEAPEAAKEEEENKKKKNELDLFTLKWEPSQSSSSYSYSSSDENNDPPIPYSSEVAVGEEKEEESKSSSSYTSYSYNSYKKPTKRELSMFISPQILATCVDKEQFSNIVQHSSLTSSKHAASGISLADCITLFSTMEKLAKEDTWYCPSCKKHVQATKKFDIWKLPETLVIHLKRFQFNRYSRDKIDSFIDYPIESLDMSQFLPEEARNQPHTVFDLYGVSNHYGGMGGGHYTAYAKIEETGKWYKFDDSMASPASESNVKTSAGYVLFYRSRNAGKVQFQGYTPTAVDEKIDFFSAAPVAQEKDDKMDDSK